MLVRDCAHARPRTSSPERLAGCVLHVVASVARRVAQRMGKAATGGNKDSNHLLPSPPPPCSEPLLSAQLQHREAHSAPRALPGPSSRCSSHTLAALPQRTSSSEWESVPARRIEPLTGMHYSQVGADAGHVGHWCRWRSDAVHEPGASVSKRRPQETPRARRLLPGSVSRAATLDSRLTPPCLCR